MADVVTFRFNDADAQRALDRLGNRAPGVIARALNRTGTSVRAVMARGVAKDVGLKVGDVREEIRVRPASDGQLSVRLSISGARIALSKFSATGPLPSRGRGTVSARIGSTRTRYPGRFLARMKSGHIGVFGRVTPAERKSAGAWSKNLPILERFGPSLPHVFSKHVPAGIARGEEQLAKNLEHEIGFALSR